MSAQSQSGHPLPREGSFSTAARIAVVLVEPQLPANVGAVARAMLTMGLSDLRLVAPADWLDADRNPDGLARASARAAGAIDVLKGARYFAGLDAALADCAFAIGTSARSRRYDWPLLTPRKAAGEMVGHAASQQVAAVFGRERSGLSNAELDLCQAHLHIPANPGYSSLNLAAAVQVVCYELRMAGLDEQAQPEPGHPEQGHQEQKPRHVGEPLATGEQMEGLYRHFQDVLTAGGFLDPEQPKHLMRRLRRLFNRAGVENSEIQLLRGMLKALDPRK